jgi:putative zinc finger/helix-turn-helix YgiT family protein
MKCYNCGKGRLTPKMTQIAGEVRGEEYSIRSEAMVCGRCGFQVLSERESVAYTVGISDAYRRAHGLLTSAELKETRDRLGLSLRKFASYVGVGLASVKRWEAGLIQDEAHDQLIRLRTDLSAARKNVEELETLMGELSQSQPQVTEVPFRDRRSWTPEWVSGSPSVAGVTSQRGLSWGGCYYA